MIVSTVPAVVYEDTYNIDTNHSCLRAHPAVAFSSHAGKPKDHSPAARLSTANTTSLWGMHDSCDERRTKQSCLPEFRKSQMDVYV